MVDLGLNFKVMVRKKKSYKIKSVKKGLMYAGIKVTLEQKTLINTMLFGLIKRYKKRDLYLWYPNKESFSNPNVRKNSWLILRKDFEKITPTAIDVKCVCTSEKILTILNKLTIN